MKKLLLILLLPVFLSFSSLGKVKYRWKPIDARFDSLAWKLECVVYKEGDREQAGSIIREMYIRAKEKENFELLNRAMYWDAWRWLETDNDSAAYLVDRLLQRIDTVGYSYDHARILFLFGRIQVLRGEILGSYHTYKKTEQYFKDIEDRLFEGKSNICIGLIFQELQEYQSAMKYLSLASECFKNEGFIESEEYNRMNISSALLHTGRQQEALQTLKSLLADDIRMNKNLLFKGNLMISLYCTSTDLKEKKEYVRKAFEIANETKNKGLLLYALANMGACFQHEGKKDSALFYFRNSLHYVTKHDDVYCKMHILYGLYKVFDSMQQTDSAYCYLKRFYYYRDSLIGKSKALEINKFESRLAIDTYELEFVQIKERQKLQNKIAWLIFSTLASVIVLISYIFWYQRRKNKAEKYLKELENKELATRLENEALQNERFMFEIDSKNRELASNTLLLTERNQVFKDMLSKIEKLGDEGFIHRKHSGELKKYIGDNLVTDDEWQYFKLHFEAVHPEFFTKLKINYPTLSENDLRLCAYIRIGMSTKQTAQMLSVLPETVNTSRYRIRKKLGLGSEDTLDDFLRRI